MAKASALRNLTVAQLEKMLHAKKSKLVDLVARRDKLKADLASLDKEISSLGGNVDDTAPRRGRPKGSVNKKAAGRKGGRRPKNEMSLGRYVEAQLSGAKKGMTVEEIMTNVQQAGYKSKSEKFRNVVYQCLFHGDQFQKDADTGRWVLVQS